MKKEGLRLIAHLIFLLYVHKSYGYDRQSYEFSVVREVDTHLTKRTLGDDNLPEYLNIELEVRGKKRTLRLQRNRNVDINIPVEFEGEKREIAVVQPIDNVAMYQDVSGGATLSVTHDKQSAQTKRTFEGSFQVGNQRYGIEPTSDILDTLASILERRKFDTSSQQGVLHRIYRLSENDDTAHDYPDSSVKSDSSSDDSSESVSDEGSGSFSDESDGPDDSMSNDAQSASERKFVKFESAESAEDTGSNSSNSDDDSTEFVAKRAAKPVAAYNVELNFVVDHTIYDYWMKVEKQKQWRALRSLKKYFAHQINGMDLAYKSIDASVWGFTITPYLKRIVVAKTPELSILSTPYIFQQGADTAHTMVDAPSALKRLSKWVTDNGRSWKKPDHAIFWTRYNLRIAKDNSDLTGYAPIARICIPGGGISIQEDRGIHSWTTSAHELAHNLGAMHDGSGNNCRKDAKYIMAPSHGLLASKSLLSNAYMFSDCSIKYFKMTLSGQRDGYPRVCLTNRICKHGVPLKYLNILPGKKYSLDEQCKLRYGDNYSWIKLNIPTDVCFKLACRIGNSNKYRFNNPGAADGSPCGENKCCRHGACVTNCESPKVQADTTCEKTGLPRVVPKGCTNIATMNCNLYPSKNPRACFTSSTVKTRCCKACHKAGLVDPSQHLITARSLESPKSDDQPCVDFKPICKAIKSLCSDISKTGQIVREACPLSCGTCALQDISTA